jgi:transcriptional regulator with XRE-family HTH domain
MGLLNDGAIGKRLRNYRENVKALSVKQFAEEAGIDRGQYYKIEAGTVSISEGVMDKLLLHYKDLHRDFILFGLSPQIARLLGVNNEQLSFAIETVGAAKTVYGKMPAIPANATAQYQLQLLHTRSEQLELVLQMLFSACDTLVATVQNARKDL